MIPQGFHVAMVFGASFAQPLQTVFAEVKRVHYLQTVVVAGLAFESVGAGGTLLYRGEHVVLELQVLHQGHVSVCHR